MSEGEIVVAGTPCANCGRPLAGKYCAACGQRHEPHIHSLREFMSEATESLTHADSRVWRTLWPLLSKPGFLTKEFLAGHRARYLPPFRLYLVLSVVFFIVAASGHSSAKFVQFSMKDGVAVSAALAPVDHNPDNPSETAEQRAHRLCDTTDYSGPGAGWVQPRILEGCRKIVADNGHEASQSLYHNVPRALIVLLPILALVMRAMYRRRYYVEHLLFFLHTHAFAFVFLTVYVLVIRFFDSGWVMSLATLALALLGPYYTYRAMRRVYEQGAWLTRLKFVVLAGSYVLLLMMTLVLTSFYTVITL